MNRNTLPCVLVAMLLLVLCHSIWGVGPTLHDDASWRLSGQQGNWHVILDWAKNQGRVFAFVSGGLIYLGTLLQGSTLGNVLHVGAFAVCFACFHAILGVYFNSRLALMTAVVNLALFAIRWEGSIVTTYPIFSWALATVFLASIYTGRRFSHNGNALVLLVSFVLLYLSLNIHEGMTVLFSLLAVLAVLANHFPESPVGLSLTRIYLNRRFVRQMTGTLGVITLYFASYFAWRLVFPSQYDGNKFGSLNPIQVVPVLLSFSATGTMLTELVMPYRVSFSDAVSLDSYTVVYKPLKYLLTSGHNLVAVLSGCFVATTAYSLLNAKPKSTFDAEQICAGKTRWIPLLIVAMSIAFVPVLPVAFVGKYQEQFFNLHIRSYAFTPICHFGWSMLIAAFVCRIDRFSRPLVRTCVAGLFALFLGTIGFCASVRNENAIADMRRETCRWEVVEHVASILPQLQPPITTVSAPRLHSGSWFTVVQSDYWSSYMQNCYKQTLKFENASITGNSIEQGVAYVDFCTAHDSWQTIVFAARLSSDAISNQIVATEIGVRSSGFDPSDRVQYLLNFRDLDRGSVAQRLSQLTPSTDDPSVVVLRNIRAVPGSIHISRYSEVQHLSLECGDHVPFNTPIRFGLNPEIGESGATWLTDGWHAPEQLGTWMSKKTASMRIPLQANVQGTLTVSLVGSTLTGRGYHDQPQTVQIRIGERVAATQRFSQGVGWLAMEFEVEQQDRSTDGTLQLEIAVDELLNPEKLGLSTEARDLGLMLQKLSIIRKPQLP